MRDLTIPSWLQLARALGDAGNQGLRKKFRKFMFMGKGSA
jgi:endopolyphosphatase